MIREIIHVGLTVSDLDRSIAFYRDVLGLTFKGEMMMEGEATDKLFAMKGCKARVAYLNGDNHIMAPPIELIQFISHDVMKKDSNLQHTSISEVCFRVDDIDVTYQRLLAHQVECLSAPQFFDLSSQGFGKSKAIYFKDPDGIILELIEVVEDEESE